METEITLITPDQAQESWIGCGHCGRPQDEASGRKHVHTRVKVGEVSHEAKTCSECKEAFWKTHLSIVDASKTNWTYKARCLAAKQLLQGAAMPVDKATIQGVKTVTPPPPATLTADRFKTSVETLTRLKEKLSSLQSYTSDAKNKSSDMFADWAKRMDAIMTDLNLLYSSEFSSTLLEHIEAFHKGLEQESVVVTKDPLYQDVKALLAELVRNMPMNRLLYKHRKLLIQILGVAKYEEKDKFILTLDGGGKFSQLLYFLQFHCYLFYELEFISGSFSWYLAVLLHALLEPLHQFYLGYLLGRPEMFLEKW